MGDAVRLGGYGNTTVDGIKVKIWVKFIMFEQTLGEVVLSPLPECIIGMDAVSDWRTLTLSNVTVKQKACKFAFLPILIGHAKWSC